MTDKTENRKSPSGVDSEGTIAFNIKPEELDDLGCDPMRLDDIYVGNAGAANKQKKILKEAARLTASLKPCPFCGDAFPQFSNTHTPCFTVECTQCTGQVCGKGNDYYIQALRDAAKTWNRRASH